MTDDERDDLDQELELIADRLDELAYRDAVAELHAVADVLDPQTFRFALHDADCESLGTITLPWPNVEHGDELTLDDGSRWIVRRVVTLGSPHTLDGMLQLEPAGDGD